MTALCAALLAAGAGAAAITVDVRRTDGSVSSRVLPLEVVDGVAAWRMTPKEAGDGVESVSVRSDFATARAGEEGFWVMPDNTLGTFKATNAVRCVSSSPMSFWGMKTSRGAFVTRIDSMKYEYVVDIVSSNGLSSVATRFRLGGVRPYEDLAIEWTFLGKDAGLGDMARVYRAHQLAAGVRPIRARVRTQPELAYAAQAVEVRIRQGWKPAPPPVKEQTPSNEPPMKVAVTFDRAGELVEACRRAGVGKAEFCLVGWNRKGHDGRYPQLFPVEPELGGEEALRRLVRRTQDLGYLIVCHNNHSDAYSVAACWTPDDIIKTAVGGLSKNACWSGGQMYNLCPEVAWTKYAQRDLPRIAALGFRGIHYIDVLSICPPRPCRDPKHPMTAADSARRLGEIGGLARSLMGGYGSEGPYDHHASVLDYCLYVSFAFPGGKLPALADRLVPLWQLVYNGIILSGPFTTCTNYPIKDEAKGLELVAFGGRPMFYVHSAFVTGFTWMGDEDLTLADERQFARTVAAIRRGAEDYARLSDLQLCYMADYREPAEGVTETVYENGTAVVVNRRKTAYSCRGVEVPPRSWKRIDTK